MYAKRQYETVLNQAWDELEVCDIRERAAVCGMECADSGAARFESLGQTLNLGVANRQIYEPDGRPARRIFQIVALHHLLRAEDTPPTGEDIPLHAFRDLMLYHNTIKWRVLDLLANAFGANPQLLIELGATLNGAPREFGDAAVMLRPFPRVAMTAVVHAGDAEFPPDATVLFDASAIKLMPPEDLVVLSELIAHKLANLAGMKVNEIDE